MSASETPAREITERREDPELPLWYHPDWTERFPWLFQATTGDGGVPDDFDLGAHGKVESRKVVSRWRGLLATSGMKTLVHSRQVHSSTVRRWFDPLPDGLIHVDGSDAHVTDRIGVLLTITVADCVPVFVVDEASRTIGLAHAGWRGVAGSIVEKTIETIMEHSGSTTDSLWLHAGPSICGECYEVGPEVHQGVNPDRRVPSGPTPIDLRAAIGRRAEGKGVRSDRVTVSGHCTLCGPGRFFSHRGGSSGRQMGLLGRRE